MPKVRFCDQANHSPEIHFFKTSCCRPKGGVLLNLATGKNEVRGAVFSMWLERTWISMRKSPNRLLASGSFRHDHAIKNVPFVWH